MKLPSAIFISVVLATSSLVARGQATNAADGLDFDSFKIITQRNIFDPNRTGRHVAKAAAGPRRIERVSLVGTIIDPREVAAFFTGSGVPDKPFKVGDSVKELKITQITEDGVRLKGQSNTFVLDFENRRSLRREENGPWQGSSDTSDPTPVASASTDETASSSSSSAPAAAATPSTGVDTVAERLRKRRLEEK